MNKKYTRALFAAATLALLGSCAATTIQSGTTSLTITGLTTTTRGGTAQSRGSGSDWPMGTLPVWSSVTLTVTGDGNTTSYPLTPDASGAATVELPVGTSRTLTLTAIPDWTATYAASTLLPTFAKAYSASATVDLVGGAMSVAMELAVSATCLILPDVTAGTLAIYESLDDTAATATIASSSVNGGTHWDFDRYGRLYVTLGTAISQYTNPDTNLGDYSYSGYTLGGVAWQRSTGNLFVTRYDSAQGSWLQAYAPPSYTAWTWTYLSMTYSGYGDAPIAADDTSYFTTSTISGESTRVILRINPAYNSYPLAVATYSAIGLSVTEPDSSTANLTVNDLRVADGVLYILASEYTLANECRGKLIALKASDLTKLWECGWAGDSNAFPTDATTQFYRPIRFVGFAPGKLYVADDGFSSSSQINRVLEVDTASHEITGEGLDGASTFVYEFSIY